jgi:hypothetical protein
MITKSIQQALPRLFARQAAAGSRISRPIFPSCSKRVLELLKKRPSSGADRSAFLFKYLDVTLSERLESFSVLSAAHYCAVMHGNGDFGIK